MELNYIINQQIASLRLDKALTLLNDTYSRVYYSNLIKEGLVLVNGKKVNPSYKVEPGDQVNVVIKKEELDPTIKPYEIDLDIIYEDEDIIIINKPRGLVVHPGDGHPNDTLVNALIYNHKKLSTINGLNRIGIVHRIDKDTTGLLLICKNDQAHLFIANQLKDHSMHREYVGLCDGNFENPAGKIIGPIGRDKNNRKKMAIDIVSGKDAVTYFTVLKRFRNYTFCKFELETGRTHQIRVHMSSIKHPLVGDSLYGGSTQIFKDGQLLHAYKLTFIHPRTHKEMSFTCPIPKYFQEILKTLD